MTNRRRFTRPGGEYAKKRTPNTSQVHLRQKAVPYLRGFLAMQFQHIVPVEVRRNELLDRVAHELHADLADRVASVLSTTAAPLMYATRAEGRADASCRVVAFFNGATRRGFRSVSVVHVDLFV